MTAQAISAAFLIKRHPKVPRLEPAEPLWKRAPTHGDDGRPLSDFMMIIPGLREKHRAELMSIVTRVERVLNHYHKAVVFADLNLRLNVLWVTVRPIPRICLDIASAIHFVVPEARLVAHKYPFW
ncbi:MAG: hypothetical protein WAN46_09365 [Gammaproteobacteria bacterium]